MTNFNKYSKPLHLVVLCCFFLPFFYSGCGLKTRQEQEATEKVYQDSLNAAINTKSISRDTSLIMSVDASLHENNSHSDTLKEQLQTQQRDTALRSEKETESLSQVISNKFKFLKILLIPEPDTYSGMATVIDLLPMFYFFSIFISFLLLTISLTVKFIESRAKMTIVLLDVLSFISFAVSESYSWDSKKLWGYWICLILILLLTIYDLCILNLNKSLARASWKKKGSP